MKSRPTVVGNLFGLHAQEISTKPHVWTYKQANRDLNVTLMEIL